MKTTWPTHFPVRIMGRSLGSSGLSSFAIALEAWRRGLEVTFTAVDLFLYTISDGQRTVSFNFSRPDSITSREQYLRLNKKGETVKVLHEADIPAPRGIILDNQTTPIELRKEAELLGYPLVLKPNDGSMGRGVLTGLQNWNELESGFNHLVNNLKTKQMVLEKHFVGDDYRVLVIGDKVAGAVKRVPANVIGDGEKSISALVTEKNLARKWNPFLTSGLIKIDFEVEKCLLDQGLKLTDVPAPGARIELRRVANASAGGDVVDVTDSLPEEIKQASIKAVSKFPGIIIAGVDILFNPQSESADGNYVIIEINSRPQIGVNMYPSIGRGRDIPKIIIDQLFPGVKRPESHLIRSLKFNESAVKVIIRSGVASKVTLPSLPVHYYPVRQKFIFEVGEQPLAFLPYTERRVQKAARAAGASGVLKVSAKSENLELYIATETEMYCKQIVDVVSRACSLKVTAQERWAGPVTSGFRVDI